MKLLFSNIFKRIKILQYKKIFIFLSLFVLLCLSFTHNIFQKSNPSFYNFQNDSEELVRSKILIDEKNIQYDSNYGLCRIRGKETGTNYGLNINNDSFYKSSEEINITQYVSQVGLQGYVFSFLHNSLKISISKINLIVASITALVIMLLCLNVKKKYSLLMGIIFYITFLLSPWIINFSRNLYWISFTWFIPALLGLKLTMNYDKKKIYIPLIFLSILFKCLCGYEYISSIMLFMISFMIVDFFTKKDKIKIIKTIIIVGITSLIAFVCAMCIHGYFRGNGNVISGVQKIYKEDVLRRTSSSENYAMQYDEQIMRDSLSASHLTVIRKYLYFDTQIIYGIDGNLFLMIVVSSIVFLIYGYLTKKENNYRDIALFIVLFCVPCSWFYLAKAHSYIHTHMNYVLWYFGFVQICFYIIVDGFIYLIRKSKIDRSKDKHEKNNSRI